MGTYFDEKKRRQSLPTFGAPEMDVIEIIAPTPIPKESADNIIRIEWTLRNGVAARVAGDLCPAHTQAVIGAMVQS